MVKKDVTTLREQLDSYIHHGYLDINSFDNPDDEAAKALTELSCLDRTLCEQYCKFILESSEIGDIYLDSRCIAHLFNLNKEYGLDYAQKNVLTMSAPVLEAVMEGLDMYSKTPFRIHFSTELIANIKKRYDELASDDAIRSMLDHSYEWFKRMYLIPAGLLDD
ncbi:hypothetical protein [Xenorhabdus sp. PB30.3]|uniref:hypothetical protein n=1 Tax=Xenorhabdus sp. PB30.3 TaxID=2788941 RepID=UPI001E4E27CC|nr:hypothetical protein [Xenorhabdus sp. PB30.3]MCC8380937.1 hypothetical protein [Xenorhabdus sp. PB30.3]